MRNKKEYEIAKGIATYLKLNYPKIIFHVDLAGLNLSRAQAGMLKATQGGRGWPDLFIAQPSGQYHGLLIELKHETPFKLNGELKKDEHLEEQRDMMAQLSERGYLAQFSWGFDMTKELIDNYLKEWKK